MAINRDWIGRTFTSEDNYLVGREKIREFAIAIGEFSPVCHDVEAAKAAGHPDLVAPPTFGFSITYRAMAGLLMNPDLGVDYSRIVHGEQGFDFVRPLCAGDDVVVESTIADIVSKGKNEILMLDQLIRTVDGDPIVKTQSITVSRGTAPQTDEG